MIPSWEEVSKIIEKADHDWCESFEAYGQKITVIKDGENIKFISSEQNSVPAGNVAENMEVQNDM